MKRRNFIKTGAIGITAIPLTTPAIASAKRQFTMASLVPKNFPGVGEHALNFINAVTRATDGRFSFKLYGAGELVDGLKSFDIASDGSVDIAHTAAYYSQGKSIALSFLTAVPFGMSPMEQTAYLLSPLGKKRALEILEPFNLVPLLCTNTGVQAGGWFRKQMHSPEDFKGLKMRIPGLGGEIMRKLGVSPITIAGGEIYHALQSGTLDATEWAGPWNDILIGFYKVAPYCYTPGIHEPNAVVHFLFNKNIWQTISTTDQALLENIAQSQYLFGMTEYQRKNAQFYQKMQHSPKIYFQHFNDSIYQAMATAAKQVYTELADTGDDITKATLQEYFAFQKKIGGWSYISDAYYVNMRTRLFDS